ncbi:MAG: AEC family transporter [Erysipelotrichaceae bacterium]|nr:AEC family transporter [Erysipelotrichaceae bacterium]MBP1529319.1 AEC family transporter [Erysipelotrichaceae bacterium]
MEIVTILIKQVFIMFVLMAIGFVAYRKQILSNQGTKDIGKLLLNVAIPMIVISNFCVEKTAEKTAELFESALLSFLCMALSVAFAYLAYHKKDQIAEFSAAFSNAGFIGIPLVQAIFGSGAVFYISVMIVLINVLQWTYGVYTITDDKSVMDFKKIMKNPLILSVGIGIVIYFLNIRLPKIAMDIISSISAINTPLAMIVSGVYLAQSDLLNAMRKKDAWLLSLSRLIVIPLIVMLVFRFLPFGSNAMKLSILLAGACPVGSNVAVFAQQYDKDYRKGVEYVCVSTLLSILALPLVIFVANLLFN